MLKKMNINVIVLLSTIFVSCNNNSSPIVSTKIEIISDINYSNGIGLVGTNSKENRYIKTLYPFGKREDTYSWKLAQWGCKYNLENAGFEEGINGITYSDSGKSISFKSIDSTTQITMKMFGSKQYLMPRQFGESWPHILLEQEFKNPQSINTIEALHFNLDFKLLFSEIKMTPESFNPELHTTQFTIYLTIQNRNKNSDGYGDFIWFGLPIYDYRFDEIMEYAEQDLGKEDASKKFIYTTASKNLFEGSAKVGKWINISTDIIEIIQDAYTTAQHRGFLKSTSNDDLYITSTNMGWETPGTFDCAIQYKGLKLTAILK